MQTKTSFLPNPSNSKDIEISQRVRLPGPLPEPEEPKRQVLQRELRDQYTDRDEPDVAQRPASKTLISAPSPIRSAPRDLPVNLQSLYQERDRSIPDRRMPEYGRANTERVYEEKERDCLDKIVNLQKRFSEVKNDVYNSFNDPAKERLKCSE